MTEYPKWLHGPNSIMGLSKPYIEFFVRWYYYDHSELTEIPDTIPVENIEDYIAEHLTSILLWEAKGFAIARNVSEGDNLDFKNDAEFCMVCHCVAKLWFKYAVNNGWIEEDISKDKFEECCNPLKHGYDIPL
jgi:hypothetical protein